MPGLGPGAALGSRPPLAWACLLTRAAGGRVKTMGFGQNLS